VTPYCLHLHLVDGGSMVLRNVLSFHNTTRRHNPKSWNLLLRSGYEWTGDDNNLGENNHHNDDSDHILKKTKII